MITDREINIVNLLRLSGQNETIPVLLVETTLDGKECTCIATLDEDGNISPLAIIVDNNDALFKRLGKLKGAEQALVL